MQSVDISDLESLTIADAQALREVAEELSRARRKFRKLNSAHEGFAVLREEVDELWEEVKLHDKRADGTRRMQNEAIQVGAMAVRFLSDVVARKYSPDFLNALGEVDRLVEQRLSEPERRALNDERARTTFGRTADHQYRDPAVDGDEPHKLWTGLTTTGEARERMAEYFANAPGGVCKAALLQFLRTGTLDGPDLPDATGDGPGGTREGLSPRPEGGS